MLETIEFSTTNNAVTHLGRNLYSTIAPALAELIANSYDAYATEVYIILENSYIVIADNGKGMSLDELNSKYCKIGKPKIQEDTIDNLVPRKPMGKKGIGKLSAFSIGSEYEVFTKSKNDKSWIKFKLNYDEMKLKDPYPTTIELLEKLPETYDLYNNFTSGFIVKISKLRKNFTSSVQQNFINKVSRRFYIFSNDFTLKINNNIVELSKNSYYKDLQIILYFGYTEHEILNIFNNKDIVFKEFTDTTDKFSTYIKNNKIKGWIGGVNKPKDLSKDGDRAFVIAYINNKIADENIFKNKSDARVANSYMVGEIQVDFLSEDSDPITSSRQGLDESNDSVKSFIDIMEEIRKKFIIEWDDFRLKNAVNTLPERIKNNQNYQDWLNGLSEEEKHINNKLLNMLSLKLDKDIKLNSSEIDSIVTSIAGVINNIEIKEIRDKMDKESLNDKEQLFSMLSILMQKIQKTEQIKMTDLITARLEAIDKLEKLMNDNSTKEKLFQEHLYKNPWLISPFWNINNDDVYFERVKEKYIKSINSDGEPQKNFIDILIKIAEEKYPIIVELKKNNPTGHAKVGFTILYEQIKKYRKALIQNLSETNKENIQEKDILAIYIMSEDASTSSLNTITITTDEYKILSDANIKLYTYGDLLHNIKNMYRDFIKIVKNKKIIPDLSNS